MKLEYADRVEKLLDELMVLKGYVRVAAEWAEQSLSYSYPHTSSKLPDNIHRTSLFSLSENRVTSQALQDAIDNVEVVFMECVTARIVEIENELEIL